MTLNRAVFLDRDGVLNKVILKEGKPLSPANLQELEIMPKAKAALTVLKQAGFKLIGVTNQPDVPRGKTTVAQIEVLNDFLMQHLPLDKIYVCYHDDADNCVCRKPKPGLILQAAKDYGVDVTKSYMIGDRWRDVEAALAANCQSIWLKAEYSEKKPTNMHFAANDMMEAASYIQQHAL